jgi:septal ring factor EnvC (AmiA/AmiB activator)
MAIQALRPPVTPEKSVNASSSPLRPSPVAPAAQKPTQSPATSTAPIRVPFNPASVVPASVQVAAAPVSAAKARFQAVVRTVIPQNRADKASPKPHRHSSDDKGKEHVKHGSSHGAQHAAHKPRVEGSDEDAERIQKQIEDLREQLLKMPEQERANSPLAAQYAALGGPPLK